MGHETAPGPPAPGRQVAGFPSPRHVPEHQSRGLAILIRTGPLFGTGPHGGCHIMLGRCILPAWPGAKPVGLSGAGRGICLPGGQRLDGLRWRALHRLRIDDRSSHRRGFLRGRRRLRLKTLDGRCVHIGGVRRRNRGHHDRLNISKNGNYCADHAADGGAEEDLRASDESLHCSAFYHEQADSATCL